MVGFISEILEGLYIVYVLHTVHIPIIITPTKLCTTRNTFMRYYKTLTCFDIEVPSSGSRSVQRNVGPTCLSISYVALTELVKILSNKILKYTKLTTIKSHVVILEVLKVRTPVRFIHIKNHIPYVVLKPKTHHNHPHRIFAIMRKDISDLTDKSVLQERGVCDTPLPADF
jgi:hypothetical protein